MSWVEVQFLKAAVDILRKSRQCLMFTYVFAFYLTPTNSTIIFEQNQVRNPMQQIEYHYMYNITCIPYSIF